MAGGNTELDAVDEAQTAARTDIPESDPGTGVEIDPLLGAGAGAGVGESALRMDADDSDADDTDAAPRVESAVITAGGPSAEDAAEAVPASDTAMRPRRRWWQRIFEYDAGTEAAKNGNGSEPGQNGHHAGGVVLAPDPGADPVLASVGRNGDTATHTATRDEARTAEEAAHSGPGDALLTDEPALEQAQLEPVAAAPDVDGRTPPRVDDALPAEPDASPDVAIGDHRAWVLPPLVEPDVESDLDDTGDATQLEPARTGEIPRVPLLAAERARLVPEPSREPSWITRRRTRRPRVRRVTRIVRRIDAWSVFKVALMFWVAAYLILLVAGVLLWSVAISTGTIDNVESFLKDLLALDTFTLDGQKIFRASWVLGAFMAVAGTGLTVTVAVLYNLFSDLVGGVRITVLEEEVVQRPASPPPS